MNSYDSYGFLQNPKDSYGFLLVIIYVTQMCQMQMCKVWSHGRQFSTEMRRMLATVYRLPHIFKVMTQQWPKTQIENTHDTTMA